MRRAGFLVALGLLLTGCGSSSSPSLSTPVVFPTRAATSAVDTVLGDAAPVRVSMAAARVDRTGDDLARPRAGHEYVVIPVTFRNTSARKGYYNDVAFKALDPTGKVYRSETLLPKRDGGLVFLCCTLRPHEVKRGIVGFSVPLGTTSLSVIYAPAGKLMAQQSVTVP